jgi:hypothetical protein
MTDLPVMVLFDKSSLLLLADLIEQEKDRITSEVFSKALTIEQLDNSTGRLDGLVKLLDALNEGAMNTIQLKRDLENVGE